MNSAEFMEFFKKLLEDDGDAFISNLSKGIYTPDVWANILIRWLELGSKEDAERYYPNYYEDKRNEYC